MDGQESWKARCPRGAGYRERLHKSGEREADDQAILSWDVVLSHPPWQDSEFVLAIRIIFIYGFKCSDPLDSSLSQLPFGSSVLSKSVANIFIFILHEKSIPLAYSRLTIRHYIFITGIFLMCNVKAIVAQVGV